MSSSSLPIISPNTANNNNNTNNTSLRRKKKNFMNSNSNSINSNSSNNEQQHYHYRSPVSAIPQQQQYQNNISSLFASLLPLSLSSSSLQPLSTSTSKLLSPIVPTTIISPTSTTTTSVAPLAFATINNTTSISNIGNSPHSGNSNNNNKGFYYHRQPSNVSQHQQYPYKSNKYSSLSSLGKAMTRHILSSYTSITIFITKIYYNKESRGAITFSCFIILYMFIMIQLSNFTENRTMSSISSSSISSSTTKENKINTNNLPILSSSSSSTTTLTSSPFSLEQQHREDTTTTSTTTVQDHHNVNNKNKKKENDLIPNLGISDNDHDEIYYNTIAYDIILSLQCDQLLIFQQQQQKTTITKQQQIQQQKKEQQQQQKQQQNQQQQKQQQQQQPKQKRPLTTVQEDNEEQKQQNSMTKNKNYDKTHSISNYLYSFFYPSTSTNNASQKTITSLSSNNNNNNKKKNNNNKTNNNNNKTKDKSINNIKNNNINNNNKQKQKQKQQSTTTLKRARNRRRLKSSSLLSISSSSSSRTKKGNSNDIKDNQIDHQYDNNNQRSRYKDAVSNDDHHNNNHHHNNNNNMNQRILYTPTTTTTKPNGLHLFCMVSYPISLWSSLSYRQPEHTKNRNTSSSITQQQYHIHCLDQHSSNNDDPIQNKTLLSLDELKKRQKELLLLWNTARSEMSINVKMMKTNKAATEVADNIPHDGTSSSLFQETLLYRTLQISYEQNQKLLNKILHVWVPSSSSLKGNNYYDHGTQNMFDMLNEQIHIDDGGLVGMEYNLGYNKLFVDIGSGLGYTNMAISILYPGTNILSIEPTSTNWLLQNLNWICHEHILDHNKQNQQQQQNQQQNPYNNDNKNNKNNNNSDTKTRPFRKIILAGIGTSTTHNQMATFQWNPYDTSDTRSWKKAAIITTKKLSTTTKMGKTTALSNSEDDNVEEEDEDGEEVEHGHDDDNDDDNSSMMTWSINVKLKPWHTILSESELFSNQNHIDIIIEKKKINGTTTTTNDLIPETATTRRIMKFNIDVMNLDCEGCEYNLIPSILNRYHHQQQQHIVLENKNSNNNNKYYEYDYLSMLGKTMIGKFYWGYISKKESLPGSVRGNITHYHLCHHEHYARNSIECCSYLNLPIISTIHDEILIRDNDNNNKKQQQKQKDNTNSYSKKLMTRAASLLSKEQPQSSSSTTSTNMIADRKVEGRDAEDEDDDIQNSNTEEEEHMVLLHNQRGATVRDVIPDDMCRHFQQWAIDHHLDTIETDWGWYISHIH